MSEDNQMLSQAKETHEKCPCGTCGSAETYGSQVRLPLAGRVRAIDVCLHDIVAALNAANIRTTASCCGHGKMPGRITLEDGRELMFFFGAEDFEKAAVALAGVLAEENRNKS